MESAKTNSLSNSLSRLMPESLISDKATSVATSAAPTFGESMASTASTSSGFFESITWQTWLIIILILAFLGINIFIYLAKATTDVSNFVNTYFGPVLRLFGFSALETTKQTINTSATGTKAGVDIVANTTTGAIDTVEDAARSNATTSNATTMPSMPTSSSSSTSNATTSNATTSNANTNKPAPQKATSSQKGSMPVQQQIQQAGGAYEWSQSSLDSALNDAAKQPEPMPNESTSYTTGYTTGKAGWCYIGDDRGTRSCAQVGVNDVCMSGDIFPTQDVCMNPNLRV